MSPVKDANPADVNNDAEVDRDLTFWIERDNVASGGNRYRAWFMTPGVINYEDCKNGGQELLRKRTIDAALDTLRGTPLTIGHIKTAEAPSIDVANGTIEGVGYDADRGWHYCDFTADTEQARNCIKNGWGVSVGMRACEFGPGGSWLNNRYDRELKRIKFHHLALVSPSEKPRIDEAVIERLNSTAKKPKMNLIKIISNAISGPSEIAPTTKIDLGGGRSATLGELIELERNNAAAKEIKADTVLEFEGGKFKVSDLVAGYRKANGLEDRPNSAETPEAKAAREKEEADKKAAADAKAEEERQNAVKAKAEAEAAEAKRIADKAAADKLAADKAAELERQNAAARGAGAEAFKILAGASSTPQTTAYRRPSSGISTAIARGKRLCGSDLPIAHGKN